MAAGSLFQLDEISGFYIRLVVALAEGPTAASVVCWDLDLCQWKVFLMSSSSKEAFRQPSIPPLLHKQWIPVFWGDTKVWIFSALTILSGCMAEHHRESTLLSQIQTKREKHCLYVLSNGDIKKAYDKEDWLIYSFLLYSHSSSKGLF